MKKSLLFSLLIVSPGLFAQNTFTLTGSDATSTSLKFNLNQYQVKSVTVDNVTKHTLVADEATPMLSAGAPEVLKFSTSLQIPNLGAYELQVINSTYTDYPNIDLLPSKGSLKRNISPASVPFTYGPEYNTNAFYPSAIAGNGNAFIVRNARGVNVYVYPFRYNPVTKVLRVYSEVNVKLVYKSEVRGDNELTQTTSSKAFEPVLEQLFKNRSAFVSPQQRYSILDEKGTMLIIADDAYISSLSSFVEWKKQKGIETEVVGISTIGTTAAVLNTYIENYYNANPDLTFVLFIGDHEDIPAYNAGSTGWETKWSDTYYGLITGNDHYPEIFIGRLPAKTQTQCTSMITKVMEYEKTPSAGTWYTNSIGIGSDEGAGIGDDNEPDWQHLRNIRTELMTFGYTTVHEFYDASHGGADASGDPTAAMVATAVETGASLFLYCGHGSQTTCVTSNYSTNEISAATNYGKYPFVVSVACNNGTFVGGECLTEEFMRASNTGGPTGAINACGSSILMAWAEPMETEDEISKILSQVSPGNLKYTFGGLFYNGQMSMLEDYPTNTGKEVMETWVMFGDPSVMIRSKTPVSMNVTNPTCFSLSSTSMNITCDLDGADVALYQDGEILSTGTVSSGSANLNFSALSSTSPITLTVTGYNRLPYQATLSQCAVGIDPVKPADVVLNMFPNPAGNVLNIQAALNNGSYSIIIRNELGQQVMTAKADASNGLNAALDVHQLTNGVYMIEVISANGDVNANNKFVKM